MLRLLRRMWQFSSCLLWRPLHTEVYADGYRFKDGYILPPEAPGLGVRLTEDLKNRYPFIRGSGEWNVIPEKLNTCKESTR